MCKEMTSPMKSIEPITMVHFCGPPFNNLSNVFCLLSEGNSEPKGKAISHAWQDTFTSKHFCIWRESIYLSLTSTAKAIGGTNGADVNGIYNEGYYYYFWQVILSFNPQKQILKETLSARIGGKQLTMLNRMSSDHIHILIMYITSQGYRQR